MRPIPVALRPFAKPAARPSPLQSSCDYLSLNVLDTLHTHLFLQSGQGNNASPHPEPGCLPPVRVPVVNSIAIQTLTHLKR